MTTDAMILLLLRMIEDINTRQLNPHTQKGHHIRACMRFAGFLKRLPDTASNEDIRLSCRA